MSVSVLPSIHVIQMEGGEGGKFQTFPAGQAEGRLERVTDDGVRWNLCQPHTNPTAGWLFCRRRDN